MPVRARIALVYALITTVAVGATGAFLAARLGSDLRRAVDEGLRARAAIIERDVVEEFSEVGAHDGVIDESEAIAQILSPSGAVLESTRTLGSNALLPPGRVRALENGDTLETTAKVDGRDRRLRLLAARASPRAVVLVGTDIADVTAAVGSLTRTLLVGGPLLLALTTAAVWLLAGAALAPVERLRAEAEALSFGIDGRRLAEPETGDEIQRLAATLNVMLDRLEEALDRERRFVDDASHELRTPLAAVKPELELALRGERGRDALEAAVRSATEEVDALARLAERMLILARADRGALPARREPVDVAALAALAAAGFERRAADAGVELDLPSDPVTADADPLLLRQVVTNLLDNALGHTPSGGRVRVEATNGADGLRLCVIDTGPGFDPQTLDSVFEPFTRADGARSRGGAGLGLSIVRAIAAAHGGSAEATNDPSGGARVVVRIP